MNNNTDAIKVLEDFLKANGECEAIIGLRLDNNKLEFDCSIGFDNSENNPSCFYAESLPAAVEGSMKLYNQHRDYFKNHKNPSQVLHPHLKARV